MTGLIAVTGLRLQSDYSGGVFNAPRSLERSHVTSIETLLRHRAHFAYAPNYQRVRSKTDRNGSTFPSPYINYALLAFSTVW